MQYFVFSFVILLCYGFWAGWLTKDDSTVSVWPQLSIVAMQSMLLFMFWMTAVNMEEQLVSTVLLQGPGVCNVTYAQWRACQPIQSNVCLCAALC